MKIKNIIFDLGNVVLKTDITKTIQRFQEYGIANIKDLLLSEENIGLYYNFECGKVTAEYFRDYVREKTNASISNSEFDEAWNNMLLEVDSDAVKIIYALKKHFRCFLISNTNIIHYDYLRKQPYWCINLFERWLFSHQIECRKPDSRIFTLMLQLADIKPEVTVFVDDMQINIDAANLLNINTILYQDMNFAELETKILLMAHILKKI